MPGRIDRLTDAMLRIEIAQRLLNDHLHRAIEEQSNGDHPQRPGDQWERKAELDQTIRALEAAAEDLLVALHELRSGTPLPAPVPRLRIANPASR